MGTFIVDFALPDHRLVIEADGVYWHSTDTQKEKDARKDHWLNAKKWAVMRLTGDEIRESPAKCIDKVEQYIKTHYGIKPR